MRFKLFPLCVINEELNYQALELAATGFKRLRIVISGVSLTGKAARVKCSGIAPV